MLFAKANAENYIAIMEVLDNFCNLSDQTMSEAKSRVYFSPNVDQDNKEAFSNILDRVKSKLAGWKANLLSMAGRAVLIQASSSAIPAYVIQSNLLPNKVLEGVDRVNRNFL